MIWKEGVPEVERKQIQIALMEEREPDFQEQTDRLAVISWAKALVNDSIARSPKRIERIGRKG